MIASPLKNNFRLVIFLTSTFSCFYLFKYFDIFLVESTDIIKSMVMQAIYFH